jgi:hypothetical protein
MYEKNGKYFADWRDRAGTRKRKSFKSERAALRFEEEMREAAHPKPQARGRLSARFSALKPLAANAKRQRSSPSKSSAKLLEMKSRKS